MPTDSLTALESTLLNILVKNFFLKISDVDLRRIACHLEPSDEAQITAKKNRDLKWLDASRHPADGVLSSFFLLSVRFEFLKNKDKLSWDSQEVSGPAMELMRTIFYSFLCDLYGGSRKKPLTLRQTTLGQLLKSQDKATQEKTQGFGEIVFESFKKILNSSLLFKLRMCFLPVFRSLNKQGVRKEIEAMIERFPAEGRLEVLSNGVFLQYPEASCSSGSVSVTWRLDRENDEGFVLLTRPKFLEENLRQQFVELSGLMSKLCAFMVEYQKNYMSVYLLRYFSQELKRWFASVLKEKELEQKVNVYNFINEFFAKIWPLLHFFEKHGLPENASRIPRLRAMIEDSKSDIVDTFQSAVDYLFSLRTTASPDVDYLFSLRTTASPDAVLSPLVFALHETGFAPHIIGMLAEYEKSHLSVVAYGIQAVFKYLKDLSRFYALAIQCARGIKKLLYLQGEEGDLYRILNEIRKNLSELQEKISRQGEAIPKELSWLVPLKMTLPMVMLLQAIEILPEEKLKMLAEAFSDPSFRVMDMIENDDGPSEGAVAVGEMDLPKIILQHLSRLSEQSVDLSSLSGDEMFTYAGIACYLIGLRCIELHHRDVGGDGLEWAQRAKANLILAKELTPEKRLNERRLSSLIAEADSMMKRTESIQTVLSSMAPESIIAWLEAKDQGVEKSECAISLALYFIDMAYQAMFPSDVVDSKEQLIRLLNVARHLNADAAAAIQWACHCFRCVDWSAVSDKSYLHHHAQLLVAINIMNTLPDHEDFRKIKAFLSLASQIYVQLREQECLRSEKLEELARRIERQITRFINYLLQVSQAVDTEREFKQAIETCCGGRVDSFIEESSIGLGRSLREYIAFNGYVLLSSIRAVEAWSATSDEIKKLRSLHRQVLQAFCDGRDDGDPGDYSFFVKIIDAVQTALQKEESPDEESKKVIRFLFSLRNALEKVYLLGECSRQLAADFSILLCSAIPFCDFRHRDDIKEQLTHFLNDIIEKFGFQAQRQCLYVLEMLQTLYLEHEALLMSELPVDGHADIESLKKYRNARRQYAQLPDAFSRLLQSAVDVLRRLLVAGDEISASDFFNQVRMNISGMLQGNPLFGDFFTFCYGKEGSTPEDEKGSMPEDRVGLLFQIQISAFFRRCLSMEDVKEQIVTDLFKPLNEGDQKALEVIQLRWAELVRQGKIEPCSVAAEPGPEPESESGVEAGAVEVVVPDEERISVPADIFVDRSDYEATCQEARKIIDDFIEANGCATNCCCFSKEQPWVKTLKDFTFPEAQNPWNRETYMSRLKQALGEVLKPVNSRVFVEVEKLLTAMPPHSCRRVTP